VPYTFEIVDLEIIGVQKEDNNIYMIHARMTTRPREHIPVPATRCHEAKSPVKTTFILCLAFEKQFVFNGGWFNHNCVAGTGKCTLLRYIITKEK